MENRRINVNHVFNSQEKIKTESVPTNLVISKEKLNERKENYMKEELKLTDINKNEELEEMKTTQKKEYKYSKNILIEKVDDYIKLNNELIKIDKIDRINVQENSIKSVEPDKKSLSYLLIPIILAGVFGLILIFMLRFSRSYSSASIGFTSLLRFLTLGAIIASILYLAYIIKEKMIQVEKYNKIFIKFFFNDNNEKEFVIFNNGNKYIVKDDNYKKLYLLADEIIARINEIK